MGFGPNPISVHDLVAYLDLMGIHDDEERREYAMFIWELDRVWLQHVSEKREQKETSNANSPSRH